MMRWIKDGLSLNETRVSSLVLAFLVTLGFALFKYAVTGDLSENMLTLLGYEIMSIAGVNVAENLTAPSKRKGSDDYENDVPMN